MSKVTHGSPHGPYVQPAIVEEQYGRDLYRMMHGPGSVHVGLHSFSHMLLPAASQPQVSKHTPAQLKDPGSQLQQHGVNGAFRTYRT